MKNLNILELEKDFFLEEIKDCVADISYMSSQYEASAENSWDKDYYYKRLIKESIKLSFLLNTYKDKNTCKKEK